MNIDDDINELLKQCELNHKNDIELARRKGISVHVNVLSLIFGNKRVKQLYSILNNNDIEIKNLTIKEIITFNDIANTKLQHYTYIVLNFAGNIFDISDENIVINKTQKVWKFINNNYSFDNFNVITDNDLINELKSMNNIKGKVIEKIETLHLHIELFIPVQKTIIINDNEYTIEISSFYIIEE